MRCASSGEGLCKKFEWVVNARPDNIYVNALPISRLCPRTALHVPSWGHGFDPKSSSKVNDGRV